MPDRAALASAILNNLADDTPRLIFADWLEENGEPERAEFIRAQIEAAKLPDKVREKSAPAKRAAGFLKKHNAEWREAAGLTNGTGQYVRGFLEGVSVFPDQLAGLAPALEVEPFTVHLRLSRRLADGVEGTPAAFRKFAKNPVLATVVSMDSETAGLGHEIFVPLIKSSHLKNLSRISLFEDLIGSRGVKAIAESPAPFVLRHLNLNSGIGNEGMDEEEPDTVAAVKLLATHPRFASLTALGLPFNSLGNKSVAQLLASKTLSRELKLGLGEDNPFDREASEDLRGRFNLVDYV